MAGSDRSRGRSGWLGLALVVIVPMLIYAAVSIGGRWIQTRGLVSEADSLYEDLLKERAENQRLQTAIAVARTDQSVESIAREELGLVKPGDTPIILLGPPGTPTVGPTPRGPRP